MRTSTILLLAACPLCSSAQLLSPPALDSVRTFRSMEKALERPDQVYRLDLSHQKLKEVPEQVFLLINLNALDLGRNKLKDLPGRLADLPYLQELRAPRNRMGSFPEVICRMSHLKRLDLSRNALDGLPVCLGDLKELVSLDLWSNDLARFPVELEGLKALRFMDLRAIQFSQEEMERITELLPWVKIHFSQPCNCGM